MVYHARFVLIPYFFFFFKFLYVSLSFEFFYLLATANLSDCNVFMKQIQWRNRPLSEVILYDIITYLLLIRIRKFVLLVWLFIIYIQHTLQITHIQIDIHIYILIHITERIKFANRYNVRKYPNIKIENTICIYI